MDEMDMFGEAEDPGEEPVRLESNGVMTFHNGTEEAMFCYIENMKGTSSHSTKAVLDLIDSYCLSRHWMMHMGPEKRSILAEAVTTIPRWDENNKPMYFLELGSYCGYSTAFLAQKLTDRGGSEKSIIVSVEPEPAAVGWTRRLVDVCGLQARSIVLQTVVSTLSSDETHQDFLPKLEALGLGEKPLFDFVFIDHDKSKYYTDLRLLLGQGLLKPGCVVVADNVLSFGQPLADYLDFVRTSPRFSGSKLYTASVEYSSCQEVPASQAEEYFVDGVEVSTVSI